MSTTIYDDEFFKLHAECSLQSARVVVPVLLNLVKPASVIDIGCGLGAWLRAFSENGVPNVRGIDGNYIKESGLLINKEEFQAEDLSSAFEIKGHYDLAVCLEVAEHIPKSNSRFLIGKLTGAAPLVLFSAAIPGQGGTGHINEQWPSYWRELFGDFGYQMLDPIRRHIYQNDKVYWWYRQNLFLCASSDAVRSSETLKREAYLAKCADMEYIHKSIACHLSDPSFKSAAVSLARSLSRAVKRRIGHKRSHQ